MQVWRWRSVLLFLHGPCELVYLCDSVWCHAAAHCLSMVFHLSSWTGDRIHMAALVVVFRTKTAAVRLAWGACAWIQKIEGDGLWVTDELRCDCYIYHSLFSNPRSSI